MASKILRTISIAQCALTHCNYISCQVVRHLALFICCSSSNVFYVLCTTLTHPSATRTYDVCVWTVHWLSSNYTQHNVTDYRAFDDGDYCCTFLWIGICKLIVQLLGHADGGGEIVVVGRCWIKCSLRVIVCNIAITSDSSNNEINEWTPIAIVLRIWLFHKIIWMCSVHCRKQIAISKLNNHKMHTIGTRATPAYYCIERTKQRRERQRQK